MDGAGLWAGANDDGLDDVVSRLSSTADVDDETRLAMEKSLRTAFTVLAVINALVGATTALGIYLDCRFQTKRKPEPMVRRFVVGAKEMLPFAVSLGIVAQGALFAAAQTKGLDAVLTLGCRSVSQLMLPALFIVPFIQTVFGFEAMARSLPRQPVRHGAAWTVSLCVGLVLVGLLISYVVTQVTQPANFCFAEMLFLVREWSVGVLAVLIALIGLLLLGSVLLLARLYRTEGMAPTQRTTASWTACYMLLAVVTMLMTVPFFASLVSDASASSDVTREMMQLSTAATIVVNLTGLLTGALYLVLRLTRLGRLGCSGYVELDRQRLKSGIRTVRASSVMYNKQLEQPLSPGWLERRAGGGSFYSWSDEKKKQPVAVSVSETRKAGGGAAPSYSIFPHPHPHLDPHPHPHAAPQIEADDFLVPPSAPWANRRERNSSLGSSATVPIALRVSNIDNIPVQQMSGSSAAAPLYQATVQQQQRRLISPGKLGLAISTNDAYRLSKTVDVFDDDDDDEDEDDDDGARGGPLPPPLAFTKADEAKPDDDGFTLSPTVYSPDSSPSVRTPPPSAQPKAWI
ncbi:hypothetical protein L249_4886 [Ophiocordyceps polyrhachis-furcata BCC 54312]|uniref:Uncharacterized protein n=1 Tax=Ophiocordyceps polyrhachis-furcata BCC 54312 TaxID=1330021 RepID=A0A367L2G0_9HYPO|nr:hypothetical protein L249_4886 [Ophiocordyceps polyrhachis-furcata BCC 54312]